MKILCSFIFFINLPYILNYILQLNIMICNKLNIQFFFLAEKYCSIVIAEGGLRIMSELLEEHSQLQNNQPGVIHSLAQTVIDQCLMYMKNTIDEARNQ